MVITHKLNELTDNQVSGRINVEENIGKTVGRRGSRKPGNVQAIGRDIYQSRGFAVCQRGVYRFDSHEEADQWMMKMAVVRALKAEG